MISSISFQICSAQNIDMSYFQNTITTQTSYKTQRHCATCKCPPNDMDSPNLYLSPFTCSSNFREPMIMTFNPRKNLFMQTNPTRTELSNSQSKVNVTFAYTSPIIIKKHHSSEGKFNTKSFKHKKFPHFNDKTEKDEAILQIYKKKNQIQSKVTINNQQKTPQKHPLLKMNKIKSNKNQEGRSIKSSNSLNIFSNSSSNTLKSQHLNEQDNAYKFHQTPINNLADQQFTPSGPVVVERDYLPKMKKKQECRQEVNYLQINKSLYPTIKSIEVYQQIFVPEEYNNESRNLSSTSLKIDDTDKKPQASDFKKLGLIEASDREIGLNISQELALNYDYFSILQESDRSLSLHVQL